MFGDWHVCRRPCHVDYNEETGNTNYWVFDPDKRHCVPNFKPNDNSSCLPAKRLPSSYYIGGQGNIEQELMEMCHVT